jgi:diguanylate cyclase (GGDEF)-like protein/PAS domain S-box-containing protein
MKLFSALGNLSLKTTITLFTAILFVSAVWILAHDLENEVRKEFQDVLAAQQFSTVEHIADSLEEATQERVLALTDTASMIRPEWIGQSDRLHQFLIEHKPQFRMFNAGLMVISIKGKGLADIPHIAGRDDFDYSASEFFLEVVRRGAPVIGKPIRDEFVHEPIVLMGTPIKDDAGHVVAVLAGAVKIVGNDLFGEVVSRKLRVGGDLHIVSPKDDVVVTSTDSRLLLQVLPPKGANIMMDRYREGYDGSGLAVSSFGVEELSSAKRVPTAGWLVIATLPTEIGFKPIKSLRSQIYLDAAVSSLVIALLLWIYLHGQLAPLSKAARSLDAMTQGSEPLRPLTSEGSQEIRRLLDSFNRLQQRIGEQQGSLREVTEQLQLSAKVFERSGESITITDANERILSVNSAFTEMTGYRAEEVIGQTPRLLASGRHDVQFYDTMWRALSETGHWQGEIWDRRKDGEVFPAWLRISVVKDSEDRPINYIYVFSDVSERKEAEARIEFMAYHDALTGLPNRQLALVHLELAIAHAERNGRKTAILYVDLDNFKTINDSFGYSVGDALLKSVAKRLADCTREADTISRQGGDEFLIILADVPDADSIASIAEKILETLDETFDVEGLELATSLSIGVAVFPDDAKDIETLLKLADTAMYHAKEAGRNAYRFYTEQMNVYAVEHQRIRVGLRRALERGELVLHYQPQVDLTTGLVVGAEALIRWNNPELGQLQPGTFIPTAEESGLIVPIGDWVLREACRQAVAWRRSGLPDIVVAVNVSSTQFKRGDLEHSVLRALEESGLPPAFLELELTESVLIQDTEKVLETVQRLKAHGLLLSIDDFGTGYSSLSYLKRFNVDKLKIDRSFVCDMLNDPQDASIVRAIIQMARSLNLKTIAEGVEDEHLLAFLKLQYCDEAQGYYFARAMPADDFARYLATNHTTVSARNIDADAVSDRKSNQRIDHA